MKAFAGYKRGINLGGWLSQCEHKREHYESFITEEDIKRISEWGLDHVRLPVDYELVQAEDGSDREGGFDYIDRCLTWCGRYGLNMILDLHKTAGYSFDEFETSEGFFQREDLQNRFIALWETFAKRYGTYENRLSFELLNEIVDQGVSDIWNGIARRAVSKIRDYAPTIHILLGGVRNNSIDSLKQLDLPYDEHIVYNFHFYEPLIFTHQAAYWVKGMPSDFSITYPAEYEEIRWNTKQYLPSDQGDIYENLSLEKMDLSFFITLFKEAVQVAKERNVALYCGEYGVIDQADISSTINWYQDINQAFETFGISRAAWTYKGKDFGITDAHYAAIFNDLISLL